MKNKQTKSKQTANTISTTFEGMESLMMSGLPSKSSLEAMVKLNTNVLLCGPHGVGKTTHILNSLESLGLTVGYYSVSTLDPFTDLVGVPFPSADDPEVLCMSRPPALLGCDVLFLDEFNRASTQTLNFLMQLIQFRQVAGNALPRLKMVVAAINPADGDIAYTTQVMDPALLDRFQHKFWVDPVFSPSVIKKEIMAKLKDVDEAEVVHLCTNLCEWAKALPNGSYVSPRRVASIAHVWAATTNLALAVSCLPPQACIPTSVLANILQKTSFKDSFIDDKQKGVQNINKNRFGTLIKYVTTGIGDISFITKDTLDVVCDSIIPKKSAEASLFINALNDNLPNIKKDISIPQAKLLYNMLSKVVTIDDVKDATPEIEIELGMIYSIREELKGLL